MRHNRGGTSRATCLIDAERLQTHDALHHGATPRCRAQPALERQNIVDRALIARGLEDLPQLGLELRILRRRHRRWLLTLVLRLQLDSARTALDVITDCTRAAFDGLTERDRLCEVPAD